MARLLLLCVVLCCYLANTSAARKLLMSLDRPTSDLSTLASAASPTTPENGRDNTANAPSSSGGGRGVATAPSPSFTVLDKNGGSFATASRVEEAPEAGQQRQGHRSSSNPVGGDVIVGGLATAFLAAIVCYIRVTRRRDDEEVQEKV